MNLSPEEIRRNRQFGILFLIVVIIMAVAWFGRTTLRDSFRSNEMTLLQKTIHLAPGQSPSQRLTLVPGSNSQVERNVSMEVNAFPGAEVYLIRDIPLAEPNLHKFDSGQPFRYLMGGPNIVSSTETKELMNSYGGTPVDYYLVVRSPSNTNAVVSVEITASK